MGNLFTCTMYNNVDPMDGQFMWQRPDGKKTSWQKTKELHIRRDARNTAREKQESIYAR